MRKCSGGEGLLPVELGETIRTDGARCDCRSPAPARRAGRGADDPPVSVKSLSVGWAAHLTAGSVPAWSPLWRRDEHPAIVERAFGAGRVLLIATSADKEWNAWPDHPTYLPIMTELLRHISRGGGGEVDRWVGSRIEFPLDPALFESDVIVRAPGYPNEPEATATAVPAEDGTGLQIRWEHAGSAGVYQFALRRRDGGETIRLAAVNVRPKRPDDGGDACRRTMGGALSMWDWDSFTLRAKPRRSGRRLLAGWRADDRAKFVVVGRKSEGRMKNGAIE